MQRKAAADKHTSKLRNSQKMDDSNSTLMDFEMDDNLQNMDSQPLKPKRPKRPKKSVNENLEPVFTATQMAVSEQPQFPPQELGSGGFRAESSQDIPMHSNSYAWEFYRLYSKAIRVVNIGLWFDVILALGGK